MANLAVTQPAKPTTRASVRQAAVKVAKKGAEGAKTAGRALARVGAKGGAIVARGAVRGGRALGRVVKENWKTMALHEGMSLGSHVGTFFADRKAKQTYLKALAGIPLLQSLATPSTLLAIVEVVGVLVTKGATRAAIREALRGTLHAKTGRSLHEWFPDAATVAVRPATRTTKTKGIREEELSGPEEEELSGPEEEELSGPEEEELSGPEEEELSGPEQEEELSGPEEEELSGPEQEEELSTRAG